MGQKNEMSRNQKVSQIKIQVQFEFQMDATLQHIMQNHCRYGADITGKIIFFQNDRSLAMY
jgi:hypothetical protein